MSKRTRYSAEFTAKVAKESIKGEETLGLLASRFSVHPTQIATWKQQALEGIADTGLASHFFDLNQTRLKIWFYSLVIEQVHAAWC